MPQCHGQNNFHSVKHVSEVTRKALNQKEPELRRKWRPLWNSGQKLEGRWCFRGYWHGQKIQRIRRQSSFSPFYAVNTVKLWLNPRTFPRGRGKEEEPSYLRFHSYYYLAGQELDICIFWFIPWSDLLKIYYWRDLSNRQPVRFFGQRAPGRVSVTGGAGGGRDPWS